MGFVLAAAEAAGIVTLAVSTVSAAEAVPEPCVRSTSQIPAPIVLANVQLMYNARPCRLQPQAVILMVLISHVPEAPVRKFRIPPLVVLAPAPVITNAKQRRRQRQVVVIPAVSMANAAEAVQEPRVQLFKILPLIAPANVLIM